ncbi:MAG TPA: N-acetylglucosaminyltransferase [Clostridiales bacterium]|nr:N-acetylglucosaminyltransferase [Clostridiales bacterium]HBR09539.1 N-acetylglucosaminyltransferase [Clostridiales bacterium]
MNMLKMLTYMNLIIVVVMTAAYFYQLVYTVVGLIFRRAKPEPETVRRHRFAALVCARNEAGVIGELVESLKRQNYPEALFDVYVLADNCTDDTADRAEAAGAIVYERYNKVKVGKGYALDYLIKRIKEDRGGVYDGYFIFDADNIVDPNFVLEMNKTFDRGFDAITCYRNSKNFGTNWITASYSIWFLREARFLNYPRMLLGSSCAVSGTGFLVSGRLIEENGGWPFHLLTEDIQFTADCVTSGHKIGYCDRAVVYDEQPKTFSQSWHQRLRWAKGFYQVDGEYLLPLFSGIFKNKGKGRRLSCYDILMTIAPGMLFTLFSFMLNLFILISFISQPRHMAMLIAAEALRFVVFGVVNFYIGMVAYAFLTVLCEWKRIRASSVRKILYIWAFPIFMATYIPIALVALKRNVEWKPIAHYSAKELAVHGAFKEG